MDRCVKAQEQCALPNLDTCHVGEETSEPEATLMVAGRQGVVLKPAASSQEASTVRSASMAILAIRVPIVHPTYATSLFFPIIPFNEFDNLRFTRKGQNRDSLRLPIHQDSAWLGS
jgi:hypothetical protein